MSTLPEATYHLEPGYLYASSQGDVIRTVVGSCVAVCLWDKVRQVGGMCHFLYPSIHEADKATVRYGNVAVPALVRAVVECGAEAAALTAQIFGGAVPPQTTIDTAGPRNVEIARAVLKKKGISVISEDVGGTMGRKILFDTHTGHVAVLKVHRLRAGDWH